MNEKFLEKKYKCPKCNKEVCDKGSERCIRCWEFVCEDCINTCDNYEGDYLNCSEDLCIKCDVDKKYCYVCNKQLYHQKDSDKCNFCYNYYCFEHTSESGCTICNKDGCDYCVKEKLIYEGPAIGWTETFCCDKCCSTRNEYF